MKELTDEEVVRRVVVGEISLYEEMVNRYQQKLRRLAGYYLKDEQAAEDAVQETLVAAYKNLEKFRPEKKFAVWLFVIAKNKVMDELRRRKKLLPLSESLPAAEEEIFGIDETDRAKLHAGLKSLPEKQNQALRLYYFADLSYQEISKRLKLPVNTIRSHLKRGKERLKKLFTNEK